MNDISEREQLGIEAYAAYGQTVGWKNYQGLPMPKWNDLSPVIQTAWMNAAAGAIAYHLRKPVVGWCRRCQENRIYDNQVARTPTCSTCGGVLYLG